MNCQTNWWVRLLDEVWNWGICNLKFHQWFSIIHVYLRLSTGLCGFMVLFRFFQRLLWIFYVSIFLLAEVSGINPWKGRNSISNLRRMYSRGIRRAQIIQFYLHNCIFHNSYFLIMFLFYFHHKLTKFNVKLKKIKKRLSKSHYELMISGKMRNSFRFFRTTRKKKRGGKKFHAHFLRDEFEINFSACLMLQIHRLFAKRPRYMRESHRFFTLRSFVLHRQVFLIHRVSTYSLPQPVFMVKNCLQTHLRHHLAL